MNIESLQYFHYIAKYNNITHAAKQLFVSQSTLSRHIMALENELGVKLFERSNKHLELTEAGKALYRDCGSFINHMESLLENVKSADQGHSGIVRITMPSQLHYVLAEPLKVMREQHPKVRLMMESYLFDEIANSVQHGLYNVGFTYDFAPFDEEEMECTPVATEDFSLAVPTCFLGPDFTAEKRPSAIKKVINSLPLILPSHVEPPFIKKFLSTFQDYAETKVIHTSYVNTTESAILNTALGLGYSIVMSSWARSPYSNSELTFLELPELPHHCTIVMLCKKSNTCELVQNFVNIVKTTSSVTL